MRAKVARAYGDTSMPGGGMGGIQHEFAGSAVQRTMPRAPFGAGGATATGGGSTRPPMADTLRSTFGDGSGGGNRAGAIIGAAYSKFRAFGL